MNTQKDTSHLDFIDTCHMDTNCNKLQGPAQILKCNRARVVHRRTSFGVISASQSSDILKLGRLSVVELPAAGGQTEIKTLLARLETFYSKWKAFSADWLTTIVFLAQPSNGRRQRGRIRQTVKRCVDRRHTILTTWYSSRITWLPPNGGKNEYGIAVTI